MTKQESKLRHWKCINYKIQDLIETFQKTDKIYLHLSKTNKLLAVKRLIKYQQLWRGRKTETYC